MGTPGPDPAFHEQLVESAPDALLVVDDDGRIVAANRQCEHLTGWPRDDLIGEPIEVLVPTRIRADHPPLRTAYTAEPATRPMGVGLELHLSVRDGHEVPVDISLSPFTHADRRYIAVAIRDVTERQRSTVALRDAREELERSVKELREQGEVLQLTNELGELLHSCQALEEAYLVLARYGAKLLPGSAGWVYRADGSTGDLELAHRWGGGPEPLALFEAAGCWGIRRGRLHLCLVDDDVACEHVQGAGRAACIPLLAQGEVLGLIVLVLDADAAVPSGFTQVARSLGERISFALANIVLRETLRQQSTRDPLTGLHNRRSLDEYLHREVARSRRSGAPVTVIAVDLDHFKTYNDTHGHAADAALVAVGGLLQIHVRVDDLACRQGGEEFVLVLPGASVEQAEVRGEELLRACRALLLGPDRGLTMSIGVASYPEHGATIEAVLEAADAALYVAKSSGRDQVVAAVS